MEQYKAVILLGNLVDWAGVSYTTQQIHAKNGGLTIKLFVSFSPSLKIRETER